MQYIKKTCLRTSVLMGMSLCFLSISNAEPVLEIAGVIEVEAASGENHEGIKSGDITLATVELIFNAEINEKVSTSLVVLHEDDDTEELVIDEGIISIDIGNGLTLSAGRMYIPFGNFETSMISDPLTLELAETQEAALQIVFETESFSGAMYMFNGEADKAGNEQDKIDDFGLYFDYTLRSDDLSLNLGLGYINNIADADGLQDSSASILEHDAGLAVHAILNAGALNINIEHIAAQDMLDDGTEPSASNIEIGYALGESTIALAYQSTEDMSGALPESKTLLSYSMILEKDIGLGFEYGNATDYDISDGGTGQSGGTLTAQLSVEF